MNKPTKLKTELIKIIKHISILIILYKGVQKRKLEKNLPKTSLHEKIRALFRTLIVNTVREKTHHCKTNSFFAVFEIENVINILPENIKERSFNFFTFEFSILIHRILLI